MNGDEDIKLIGPLEGNPRLEVKSHRCPECGFHSRELGMLCSVCLKRRFLREVLELQRDLLRLDPGYPIPVGKVRNRPHIAVIGHADLAWCGDRITKPRVGRVYLSRGEEFPPGTCGACLDAFSKVMRGEN